MFGRLQAIRDGFLVSRTVFRRGVAGRRRYANSPMSTCAVMSAVAVAGPSDRFCPSTRASSLLVEASDNTDVVYSSMLNLACANLLLALPTVLPF